MEAAETLGAPVIVGTAEVLLPYAPLENVADLLLPMARRARVPVVVHYDHGLTFDRCLEALKLGFSSLMYDCSTDPYEENVRKVAELTRIARAFGASVEAELGHVGNNEDSAEGGSHLADPAAFYTDPAQAADFIQKTRADALAIAVGSAHGAYKLPPKLDFDRIKAIGAAIPTPLVLHGGSGLTDEDFRRAIACGISKINIFTDLNVAGAKAAREALEGGAAAMTQLMNRQAEAIKEAAMEKMACFGCQGRA